VEPGLEGGPRLERADVAEVVVGRDVRRRRTQIEQSSDHHLRIVRTPAQRLGAREQIHEIGIVGLAFLDRAPCQVKESLVIAGRGRRLRLVAALGCGETGIRRCLNGRDRACQGRDAPDGGEEDKKRTHL
jgi:hypothetical protein